MKFKVHVNSLVSARSENEAREKFKQLLLADGNIQLEKADDILTSPLKVYRNLKSIRQLKKEVFVGVALNSRNGIIKKEVISIGTLNSALVHPREVFEFAIRHSAAAIIIAHNHPSGNTEPSEEDIKVTKRLADAGEIIGIEVLDHLIVSHTGYTSLKEKDLL